MAKNTKIKNPALSDKQKAFADELYAKIAERDNLPIKQLPAETVAELRKFDLDRLLREGNSKEPATAKQVEAVNKILADVRNKKAIEYHKKGGLNKYTAGVIIEMSEVKEFKDPLGAFFKK